MSEETATALKDEKKAASLSKDRPEAAEKKVDEVYYFPEIKSGASCFYDSDNKVWWLGIKMDTVNPLVGIVLIDKAKSDFCEKFDRMVFEIQQASKLVKPGIRELFERAAKKAGLIRN